MTASIVHDVQRLASRSFGIWFIACAASSCPMPCLAQSTAAVSSPAGSAAAALSPEAALAELKTGTRPAAVRLAELEAAIKPAADAAPAEPRWILARALIERAKGNRTPAKELAAQAAALAPADPDTLFWKGTTIFEGIQDVGVFSKMSAADDGKAAYEACIAADPAHIGARQGLIQFYVNAPGIAGGSWAKAKEQARAIIAIPGKERTGWLTLAGVAMAEEEWADMSTAYDSALKAAANSEEQLEVLRSHAFVLLNKKKDAKAALALLDGSGLLPATDDKTNYVLGEVYSGLARWPEAIASYQTVLKTNATAGNVLIGLGKAQVASGDPKSAVDSFQRFIDAYPNDPRTESTKELLASAKKKAK